MKRYQYDDKEKLYIENYNSYNNISEAYDYDDIDKVKRNINSKKLSGKRRIKYIYSKNKKEGITFSTYMVLFIFFISGVLITISYSAVTMKRRDNMMLQKELKNIKNVTSQLKCELSESLKLEEIEHIARTKLDMKEPEAHQIIYIKVPKKSYTVQIFKPEDTNKKFDIKLKRTIKMIQEKFLRDD